MTPDLKQWVVKVRWLDDGWFGLRLQYDPIIIDAFKDAIASDNRRWVDGKREWQFAPAMYERVAEMVRGYWLVDLPPAPTAAAPFKLPPLPPITCRICGGRMSSARVRDTCGGMRPCREG